MYIYSIVLSLMERQSDKSYVDGRQYISVLGLTVIPVSGA